MKQRLEDRIRELCTKVAGSKDSPEWEEDIRKLQDDLKEHISRVRKMAAEIPIRPDRRFKE